MTLANYFKIFVSKVSTESKKITTRSQEPLKILVLGVHLGRPVAHLRTMSKYLFWPKPKSRELFLRNLEQTS